MISVKADTLSTRIGGAIVNNQDVAMLMLREGASPRRQWILQGAVTAMGRGEDCHVVVDDRRASRHHARITQTADGYVLEDLGSKNGTYLNGQLLTAPTVLKDGDEISIGFAAKLTFVDAGATAPLVFDASLGPSLHMDTAAKRVWVAGKELDPPLSLAQYRMLELLHQNQGEVVSREEVVSAVWAEDASEGVSEQAIDALARRLRERIAEADPDNQYVVTVRGHGFRLDHAD
jgi:predicted component of type VI protein secretion system